MKKHSWKPAWKLVPDRVLGAGPPPGWYESRQQAAKKAKKSKKAKKESDG